MALLWDWEKRQFLTLRKLYVTDTTEVAKNAVSAVRFYDQKAGI